MNVAKKIGVTSLVGPALARSRGVNTETYPPHFWLTSELPLRPSHHPLMDGVPTSSLSLMASAQVVMPATLYCYAARPSRFLKPLPNTLPIITVPTLSKTNIQPGSN